MERATSRDGTSIAFDRIGSGAPVILVDGAMCRRNFGPAGPLAKLLAPHFTVFTYDRRGRGDSGDTLPYEVAREVEDLAAILEAAGGSAFVYGISSGAALALEGASRGLPIRKLVLYESPMKVDATSTPIAPDFLDGLKGAVAAGERTAAVKMFLRLVEAPRLVVALMPLFPPFRKMKEIAHTLVYDVSIVEGTLRGTPLPAARWKGAGMPILVVDGGKSPAWMRDGARSLAAVLPDAEYRTLPGQTHMLSPQAIVPVLREFFQ